MLAQPGSELASLPPLERQCEMSSSAVLIAIHCLALLFPLSVLWFWLVHNTTWGLAYDCVPARQTISASVQPASSLRCNRIVLPPKWYNATAAPYNPAAARHPRTGEWYLLHVADQARLCLAWCTASPFSLCDLFFPFFFCLQWARTHSKCLAACLVRLVYCSHSNAQPCRASAE